MNDKDVISWLVYDTRDIVIRYNSSTIFVYLVDGWELTTEDSFVYVPFVCRYHYTLCIQPTCLILLFSLVSALYISYKFLMSFFITIFGKNIY